LELMTVASSSTVAMVPPPPPSAVMTSAWVKVRFCVVPSTETSNFSVSDAPSEKDEKAPGAVTPPEVAAVPAVGAV